MQERCRMFDFSISENVPWIDDTASRKTRGNIKIELPNSLDIDNIAALWSKKFGYHV